MREEDLVHIRNLPLFREMTAANFDQLMQKAYFQQFPPRVQLIAEGDRADFLYVLADGQVELLARTEERETTMGLVVPVSAFILAASLKDAPCLMSARTNGTCRLLLIPSGDIRDMFLRDPAFARAMVIELATAYRSMVKALKNQKLRNSVERLANYLLRKHKDSGSTGTVLLDIDKRTLASYLGMTPENLSRAFGSLKSYGVAAEGREIRLTKLAELQTLARPTPLIDDAHS